MCTICESDLQRFHKRFRGKERVLGNGVPEIVVLRGIGVAKGDVADDAEGDKRYLVDITGLGDGTRLHIDGFGLGEQVDDATHLLFRVNKPVAGDHKPEMGAECGIWKKRREL